MLGDCSINRRLTSTKQNDKWCCWLLETAQAFRSDVLTLRDGWFSASISQFEAQGIRHVIKWPHAHDNGMTEPVNGCTKEEFRELCKGGAQNTTVCKVCSCSTVEVWKDVLICRVAFKNSVYKSSYSTWSWLTMASSATEIAGLYG